MTMEKTTTEKLFRVLVIGGAMLASGRAAPACGPGSTDNGGQAVSAFDADAAGKLQLDGHTSWGAL